MPIGIAEVDAAAAIPVVDFHIVGSEGSAAVGQPFRLHSPEDVVEIGLADFESIMLRLERGAIVEIERQRLARDPNRSEMTERSLILEAENPFIKPRGLFLVMRRYDRVVQFDFHDAFPPFAGAIRSYAPGLNNRQA